MSEPGQASLLARLGVALLATGAAALAREVMSLVVGNRVPFHPFYPAIIVSAWYGGLWPGLLSTLLSTCFVALRWREPAERSGAADIGEHIALVMFVGVGVAISGLNEILHRRTRRLVAARDEAERASCAKDEFLSVLSHELRTPLTSVLGWANMLRTRKLDATTQARALDAIERNAAAQARLVEDILEMSRIVTGKLRLDLRPADPAAVVRAALEVVKPAADAKGITLEAALDPAIGMIQADPDRLQQIAWNLLSNAVKFTPRGGRVEIRVERRPSELRLQVVDTGQGISAEFLPHVFERFTQADASAKRMHGGLGLGLAIVKHLVDLHGGTITAESDGPGKGARFTVSLPIRAASPAEARPADPPSRSVVSLAGIRVLVVDDDPDICAFVAAVLEERGATVAVAASADEALRALASGPFNVLVSDLGMPGEDGYALMKRVSAMLAEQKRRVPALALTAYASAEDAERARRAGFQVHIAKPAAAEQLVQVVAQLAASPAT